MPRPTITHEMKLAAAMQVAKNLDGDAEVIATAYSYPMDGYQLARELDDRHYWNISASDVEELDQMDCLVRHELERAEKEWVEREARSYDRLYPRAAPHVAVRLVPVLDTASSDAVGRDVALAIDWVRSNAGEHAAVIENALAAYDPERVGARTVRVPTSGVDIQALQEQAEAWEAVFETLNEVYPGWTSVRPEGTGVELACEAIRHFAAQAPDLRPITDYVKD